MNYVITALIASLIAFGAAWKAQDWRYGEQINGIKATYAQSAEKAQKDAREKEQAFQTRLSEAINEANDRAQKNAAAATAARAANDSLRQQLASARSSLPTATCEAARNYAATLSDVFGECTERYRELAEKATGHASDVMTLEKGWP